MEKQFVRLISDLTLPVEGQYPRPWTSRTRTPFEVKGFIVGYHQLKSYSSEALSHEDFLGWHFGQKGTSYDLYHSFYPEPSLTRINIENLVQYLGVPVLETNTYCYSREDGGDLSLEGRERGVLLAHTVLAGLKPGFVVVFGSRAKQAFMFELQRKKAIVESKIEKLTVTSDHKLEAFWLTLSAKALQPELSGDFVILAAFIPSLSLPEWNKWKKDSGALFGRLKLLLDKHDLLSTTRSGVLQ